MDYWVSVGETVETVGMHVFYARQESVAKNPGGYSSRSLRRWTMLDRSTH